MIRRLGLDPDTRVLRSHSTSEGVDENSVLVIRHWRYAGRGHSTGQAVFARSIAEDIADNRRIARQALRGDDPWEGAA
jgi:hypothetical protein